MFIYAVLFLGIVFLVIYNQKVFPKAIKEKKDYMIYAPGILEAIVLIISGSGLVVPTVYATMMLMHWANFSKVQEIKDEDNEWVKKNLYIRIAIFVIIYFLAITLFFPLKTTYGEM